MSGPLHHTWTWALYPRSKVPFVRMLHRGFELRIQHWPHAPFNNTRWDVLDDVHSTRAFGYCETIEDAEFLAISVADLHRDRLAVGPELDVFLPLVPVSSLKEKPIEKA